MVATTKASRRASSSSGSASGCSGTAGCRASETSNQKATFQQTDLQYDALRLLVRNLAENAEEDTFSNELKILFSQECFTRTLSWSGTAKAAEEENELRARAAAFLQFLKTVENVPATERRIEIGEGARSSVPACDWVFKSLSQLSRQLHHHPRVSIRRGSSLRSCSGGRPRPADRGETLVTGDTWNNG